MKKFLIIVVLILVSVLCWAEAKIIPLNDSIMKPNQIVVGNEYIYITEGTTISIFSIKDYKFISKFGKTGEGPGEIQGSRRGNVNFTLIPIDKKLYLFNRGKVMYFSNEGSFINELRYTGGFMRNLLPIGANYVGRSFTGMRRGRGNRNDAKSSVNIFDKSLKKVKSFYGEGKAAGFGSFLNFYSPESIFILKTGNDNIYITDTIDMKINVFNKDGKKTGEISQTYKNKKVPASRLDEIHDYFKNHPRFKLFYERIKKRITIGKTLPAIRNFFIDKNMLFVQTYIDSDKGTEFYVFDKSGKFVKKTFLPVQKINVVDFYPFSIQNGTLYQIVENEDEEEWELHISKI